ncbi:conserved Plasmodium protein, unknown function [Plasmodium berghei]|uniref:Uncharacterized protein n=2 Tax=Plasmodium berghei TaxID=5821 RepID=A0A509AQY1_PLABA|nr:conserved Plasmodium protein, unknown function [Plasmodium berghei ANKA]CXJ22179.1 conserved Plasmodium protein, unknown function [Plasmodium berghei]VUC58445.1 conserved Plasmodium protein, unknown function [Plasmodium berghei ANKA]|eukprot:XP_034424208.1 conserved Plasmodium protein, unknown function [Plasmodium berghei ANKA]
MVNNKCEVCGSSSFRVEDGMYVCDDCNYVNEEIQEHFDDAYEIKDDKINIEYEYVEKDIYNIIQKLYKDKDLIVNITKYVLKENDEFFINFQKILFEICQILISDYNFPTVLYNEVKKVWFYLLEDCIKKCNIYRPPNDNKYSLRYIYEVIKYKDITDIFKNVVNDININEEIRNTIKKMGYSKTNYYFSIQKQYINKIGQMAEFYPKKSEMNRKFNIRFLKLYKKTSLLDNENQNKSSFKKLNELIANLKTNKIKDDLNILKKKEINQANTNQKIFIENYKDNEYAPQNDYTFNNNENILDHFVETNDNMNPFEKSDFLYNPDEFLNQENWNSFQNFNEQTKQKKKNISNPKCIQENLSQLEKNNFNENYSILDNEKIYHFYSSNFINKMLQYKNLLKPYNRDDPIKYMNRTTNYNKLIGIIYQHDFLYYFIEDLKKKSDIEHLSYYDILQIFKGNYDQIIFEFLENKNNEINKTENFNENEENSLNRHASEEKLNDVFLSTYHQKELENEQSTKMKENSEMFTLFDELELKKEFKFNENLEGIEIKSEFKLSDDFGEFVNANYNQMNRNEIDIISNWDNSEKTESSRKWGNFNYKIENAKINEGEKHKNKINEKIIIENIFEKYKNYITLKKDVPKNNIETKVDIHENIFNDKDSQSCLSNREINFIDQNYNKKENVLNNRFENLDSYSLDADNILQLPNDGMLENFEKIEINMKKIGEKNEKNEGNGEENIPFSKINLEERKENDKYPNKIKFSNINKNTNEFTNETSNEQCKEIDNDLKKNEIKNMSIYDKLECVNNLKKEKLQNFTNQNIQITNDSYYNGVMKKIDKSIKKVKIFMEENHLENINVQKSDCNKIYVNEKLLLDTYIFEELYTKNLYVSSIKTFRNVTIKYIYNEYISYFLNKYKEYMNDNEECKYCYNFTFELIFYILYYSFKRLNIYCLPHNMKYFVNSDNFNLYHIFNSTSEKFYKLFKELDSINFPLKNSYFSEIKKFFFTKTLNYEVPFLCIHMHEKFNVLDSGDNLLEDNEYILNEKPFCNKINDNAPNSSAFVNNNTIINNLQIYETIGLNKIFRKYKTYTINSSIKKRWSKMLNKFNGYSLTKIYSLINDLLFTFNLSNKVQMYSIKIFNIIIFRYRFFKFLYNTFCNKYDDMHIQLNDYYNYKNIYKDCLEYYPKYIEANASISYINTYINHLKKKELYIKKKYIETKKYINLEDGSVNYQIYNKINYFYRQKFYYTFCNVNYHIDFKKTELYKIAAGCVIAACKLYYPFFIDEFYDYQNLYIPDKFEGFHIANHYNCHIQENVNLYNRIYPFEKKTTQKKKRFHKYNMDIFERDQDLKNKSNDFILKEKTIQEYKQDEKNDNFYMSKIERLLKKTEEKKKKKNELDAGADHLDMLGSNACPNKNSFEKKRKNYKSDENFKGEKVRKLNNHTYTDENILDTLEIFQEKEKEKFYSSNVIDCNTHINDFHCAYSNELNKCQFVDLPFLNENCENDKNESFYIDVLNEKESNYFVPYLNKKIKKSEINILGDFFDDNYIDEGIHKLVSYGNKIDGSSRLLNKRKSQKDNQMKKQKKNKLRIRGIYFKSIKENVISYFIPIPNIINLYFNYKKCLSIDVYKDFINKEISLLDVGNGTSDEIYNDEVEYFENNIFKKLFKKINQKEYIIRNKKNSLRKIKSSKMINDEIYKNYIIKRKSYINLDRINKKKKEKKLIFTKFCILKNNRNFEEIYNMHSKNTECVIKDLERVEKIKTKLFPLFLANYYVHPFNYFSINIHTICFYNLIKKIEKDNMFSLSLKRNKKWEIICDLFKNKNKTTYFHFLQQIYEDIQNIKSNSPDVSISKNCINNTSEKVNIVDNNSSHPQKNTSINSQLGMEHATELNDVVLLENLTNLKNKKIKKRKKNALITETEFEKIMKKKKSENIDSHSSDIIFNNEATNFIKENKFGIKNGRNIYKIINNINKIDIGIDKKYENKKNDVKIYYPYLINKKNYEQTYLIYVIFEHNILGLYSFKIESILNSFKFLIENMDNIYQLYLLYYQVNHVIYLFTNCTSYIINMYKYFLFIRHKKKYITKNNFKSFYRNKYIKKKKKFIYSIQMVLVILRIFINLYGSSNDVYEFDLKINGKEQNINNNNNNDNNINNSDNNNINNNNDNNNNNNNDNKYNLIKLEPVIYFDNVHFSTEDKYQSLDDLSLYLYYAIKYGNYYLSYLFDNFIGIKYIQREINKKNKYLLNKLNQKMKKEYKQMDNVHAYIFPPIYGISHNIIILDMNFFLINFKRIIKLIQNNYDNYLSNYSKKYNFMNKDNFEKTQVLTIATIQVEKKKNENKIETIISKKKVTTYIPTYISQLYALNHTRKEMPHMFKYKKRFICLNKYYFLHDGQINTIKKIIKNVTIKHSKLIWYNIIKEFTNCKEYKVKLLKNKYLQNENDNLNILNDFEYATNYEIINYFPISFFKFYKKMKNKTKNKMKSTHYIFLLYYWKFYSNLKKGNHFNFKKLFINEKMAKLIYGILFLYSIKRGNTIEENNIHKKKVKKLLNKYNIMDYGKLFHHILNVEFILSNQKKITNMKYMKNRKQLINCSIYFPIENTTKCKKKHLFKKEGHKLIGTFNNINNFKYSFQPFNLITKRTNCIYNGIRIEPMSILKYQTNFVNFTKILYNSQMKLNENYNKNFFFNIINEEVLNDNIGKEGIKDTLIKNSKLNKKKKNYFLELERFSQSIMIYDFLNNNKKIFLIKNIDNLYEHLKKENTNLNIDNLNSQNKNNVVSQTDKENLKKKKKCDKDSKKKLLNNFSYIQAIKKHSNEGELNIRKSYNIDKLPYNLLWDQNTLEPVFVNNSDNHMINNITNNSGDDDTQLEHGKYFYNNRDSFINAENSNNKTHYILYNFECIPYSKSKLYKNLKCLFSNVPLNYKLYKLISEKCWENGHILPKNAKEYVKIIDNIVYGSRNSNKINLTKNHKENNNININVRDNDEYIYMSTDADSYKSDTVYNIKLYKTDLYNKFKKYVKKNLIKLKLVTKDKPNCYINKCANDINNSEINNSLFHDICKTYLNFFQKINDYFYFENNNKNNHNHTNYGNIVDNNNFNIIKYKYGNKHNLDRIFEWHNNLDIYDPLLTLNNKSFINDKSNKKKKTWICIYNDRSYVNLNNPAILAEIRKRDKEESTLLNYNFNKNVHFEFNSNLNCFILRFKNNYIKNKNINLYITIKENKSHKVKYAQNIKKTNKYTYFLFSCLIFPVYITIKIMYVFSLEYFPSLFFKTLNYLNYLKIDEEFFNFLQCNEYKAINEIFYNYHHTKDENNLLDILRFRGYYINPFSFLGSIFYLSELKNISSHFNLHPTNHFNTMHHIWGIERTTNLIHLEKLEKKLKNKIKNKRIFRYLQVLNQNRTPLSTQKKTKEIISNNSNNRDNINENHQKNQILKEGVKKFRKKKIKIKKNTDNLDNDINNNYKEAFRKARKKREIWIKRAKCNESSLNELFYIKFEDDLENNIKDEEIDKFFKNKNYINCDNDNNIDEKNEASNLFDHTKGSKQKIFKKMQVSKSIDSFLYKYTYNVATLLKKKNKKKKKKKKKKSYNDEHYNEQVEKNVIEIPNLENYDNTEKINKRKKISGKHKKKDFTYLLNKYLEKYIHTNCFNNYSNESETINLYNMIITFLNNKALLNNDSITYEKYIKKNFIEINYSIYKEFTIHSNYYMQEFDIYPLNKFINTFYNNNFKALYLNYQKIKNKKHMSPDHQQKVEYIQNIDNISKTSNSLSIVQNYENEKIAYDGIEENYDKSYAENYDENYGENVKDGYIINGNDNVYDNLLDSLDNNIEKDESNKYENDIISQIDDLDQIESIKYLSGGDSFDALNEIDKNSINKSDKESINLIENDKTQNTDESSEYADGSLFDEEEQEQSDKDYVSYSFYLHKPVYIYDEKKEMKKALSGIENEESEIDGEKTEAKDEITKKNRDANKWDSNIFLIKTKQYKKVYKKLIKKIEYDRNIKNQCYPLYDKNNKFLMRDYKCIKQENILGKFTKKHVIRVGKRKPIYNLLKGRHLLINCISNNFYTYDQEVRTMVRMYKRHKFILKNQKQKYFLKKYKNSYPWIGENMFICENDINKYVAAAYSTILFHKNTTYLKHFNYHNAREYIPSFREHRNKELNKIPTMLYLLIKAFSVYLNCSFRELIIILKRIERTFLFC